MYKFIKHALPACAAILLLAACTPRYDWREVRGSNAPFTVLLPAKPEVMTRSLNLNGAPVSMTMTGVRRDGVSFAVGSAQLPSAAAARAALPLMQQAIVANLDAEIDHQGSADDVPVSGASMLELDAHRRVLQKGQPVRLLARFVAHDTRVYQLLLLGPQAELTSDVIDTFISSFKLEPGAGR